MFKHLVTLCAAGAALFASQMIHAQAPAEDRAAPSKPATQAEKDAAKAKRHAVGKETAAKGEGRLEDHGHAGGTAKVSAEDKALGKAKRHAAGKEATKAGSGRLDDVEMKK